MDAGAPPRLIETNIDMQSPEGTGPFHTIADEHLEHLLPKEVPEHVVRRIVLELLDGVNRRTVEAEPQPAPQSRSALPRPA